MDNGVRQKLRESRYYDVVSNENYKSIIITMFFSHFRAEN